MICRVAVNTLTRLSPERNFGKYWYVNPNAYTIGPFDTKDEMEADIKKYYKEPEDANE